MSDLNRAPSPTSPQDSQNERSLLAVGVDQLASGMQPNTAEPQTTSWASGSLDRLKAIAGSGVFREAAMGLAKSLGEHLRRRPTRFGDWQTFGGFNLGLTTIEAPARAVRPLYRLLRRIVAHRRDVYEWSEDILDPLLESLAYAQPEHGSQVTFTVRWPLFLTQLVLVSMVLDKFDPTDAERRSFKQCFSKAQWMADVFMETENAEVLRESWAEIEFEPAGDYKGWRAVMTRFDNLPGELRRASLPQAMLDLADLNLQRKYRAKPSRLEVLQENHNRTMAERRTAWEAELADMQANSNATVI